MTSQLPERPNLEQLKRQAKDLLRGARRSDPNALARFRRLPAFAQTTDTELARAPLSLHDAQSVIAREHGFVSWPALHERVEAMTLDFDAAVQEFVAAATSGRTERAQRMLALYPKIARATFVTALLCGEIEFVERALRDNPRLATEPTGPRDWPALVYLCHATAPTPAAQANAAAMARVLIAADADPNTRCPWPHHGVHRPVLYAACFVARDLTLAGALLETGANPNDGVTLTLAAGGGDVAALALLRQHGANPNDPWATDGGSPLYTILSWATTSVGIFWLLENGADPDEVFVPTGESPLHRAAARWPVDVVAPMVERGANPERRRRDGRTPYAIAALNGNQPVADWLRARGANPELPEIDRFVAAARCGDLVTVQTMLTGHPALRDQLTDEHYRVLHQAAESGDVAALRAMLAAGFDPSRPDDEIGKTALHSAAQAGQVEACRVLLDAHASVVVRDREFLGTPLIWAADGARNHPERSADFDAIARLLLAAGAPTDWEQSAMPSEDVLDVLERWRSVG